MRPSVFHGILGFALILVVSSAAANPLTISRDAPLYSEARAGSAVVTRLKQGTPGEQVGKQGAWLNVKTGAGTGWLLSTNVTYGESSATATPSGGGSGGFNPLAPRPQATNTVGIRGFDEETINSALGGGAVSAAQLALLDGYKAEKPDGASFASSKSLQASKVPY
jgi:hypothetical protein